VIRELNFTNDICRLFTLTRTDLGRAGIKILLQHQINFEKKKKRPSVKKKKTLYLAVFSHILVFSYLNLVRISQTFCGVQA